MASFVAFSLCLWLDCVVLCDVPLPLLSLSSSGWTPFRFHGVFIVVVVFHWLAFRYLLSVICISFFLSFSSLKTFLRPWMILVMKVDQHRLLPHRLPNPKRMLPRNHPNQMILRLLLLRQVWQVTIVVLVLVVMIPSSKIGTFPPCPCLFWFLDGWLVGYWTALL